VKFVYTELGTIDSTNSWMTQRAASLPTGSVVYSHHQLSGRGRQGRSWVTLPGDSLAFSLLLDAPSLKVAKTWVPLLAGASLVQVVRDLGVAEASVKWPNDVLVDGSKLAGILVEALPDSRLVVGMGINLHSSASSLPSDGATSLALQGVTVTDSVRQVIEPVAVLMDKHLSLSSSLAPDVVHNRWRDIVTKYLSTPGQTVDYEVSLGVMARGVARGLADDGALIVAAGGDKPDFTVHAGDIFHIERS
jgi:BirA family transcriptional regulator, biotin operon repressor / biotin---[acetyl-CoA-carboxylase] ligase